MWKLSGNPKTQKINRQLAKLFMEMEAAPGDRPLSERRLQIYEQIVRQGAFRPCSWAAAFCEQTGTTYRVNGKHTSTLLSTIEPLPELYAVVEYYTCETLQEVAELYSTYDNKTQSRTVSDINRSFARTVPQLDGVDDRTINNTVAAIAYNTHLDQYRNKTQPAERAELLTDNYDFASWAFKLLGSGHNKNSHLKRVAVFAAMLGSYRKNKVDAEQFWIEVRDETAPIPTDPTRKLAKFLLLNTSSKGFQGATAKRYRVTDREFYVKCIHSWNAWRKNEKTNLAYHLNTEVPDFQ